MKKPNEHGFVAIEFVLGLCVLLLPVTLLVSVMPTWSERKEMGVVAAREAARTYVLTYNSQEAKQVVEQIANNYKVKPESVTLELAGDPTQRGAEVEAVVHVKVPVTAIPIMNANGDAFTVTQSHTEVVDLYRSMP